MGGNEDDKTTTGKKDKKLTAFSNPSREKKSLGYRTPHNSFQHCFTSLFSQEVLSSLYNQPGYHLSLSFCIEVHNCYNNPFVKSGSDGSAPSHITLFKGYLWAWLASVIVVVLVGYIV